jgi:ketosteroid isomerase-like protein
MLMAAYASISAAVTPAVAGHQAGEETAVLAAMDRYLHAISNRDVQTMAAMQTPDGMTYVAVAQKGTDMRIVARPNSYWVDPARAGRPAFRERYWSPTVLIRGSIAMVWAPYELWEDGKTSHCGVDVFSLARIDGAWRVSNAMWTVEPEACEELRPADPGTLRPAE